MGSTVALELNKTLGEFLPSSAFSDPEEFETRLQSNTTSKTFKPPGKLLTTYARNGRSFEIWAGSLLDPAIRALIDRVQIFILLFIEAGSMLKTKDADWTLDRWKVYFLYEVTQPDSSSASPYVLAGYCTAYRFYRFQQPVKSKTVEPFPAAETVTCFTLPSVLRISQFLILPPFQSAGHGSALYRAIYSDVANDPTIVELSVEDPSEEFDRLRDINDWKILEPRFQAANVKINTAPYGTAANARRGRLPTGKLLSVESLRKIRISTKIASRQYARQVEMYLLSLIPQSHRASGGASLTKLVVQKDRTSDPDDKAYYWWRLLVKQRIMKKNRDVLQQLDLADRFPKIEDSTRGVEDEYEGLLLYMVAQQAKEIMRNGDDHAEGSAPRKRKVVDDDDDEEMVDASTPAEKRLRQDDD